MKNYHDFGHCDDPNLMPRYAVNLTAHRSLGVKSFKPWVKLPPSCCAHDGKGSCAFKIGSSREIHRYPSNTKEGVEVRGLGFSKWPLLS